MQVQEDAAVTILKAGVYCSQNTRKLVVVGDTDLFYSTVISCSYQEQFFQSGKYGGEAHDINRVNKSLGTDLCTQLPFPIHLRVAT